MTEQDRPVYCARCGSIVQAGDRFCGVCGASITPDAQEAAPTQEIPTVVQPPPQGVPAHGRNSTLSLLVGFGALAAVVLAIGAIVALNLLGGKSGEPQHEGQVKPPPVATTQQGNEGKSISSPEHSASDAQDQSQKVVHEKTVVVQQPKVDTPAPSDANAAAYQAVVVYYSNAESSNWSYTYNDLTASDQT